MSKINFTLEKANGSEALELNYERVFAIGYAGRNMEKTMEHIKELEEQLGVPAPKRCLLYTSDAADEGLV